MFRGQEGILCCVFIMLARCVTGVSGNRAIQLVETVIHKYVVSLSPNKFEWRSETFRLETVIGVFAHRAIWPRVKNQSAFAHEFRRETCSERCVCAAERARRTKHRATQKASKADRVIPNVV